jgi:hypothetical protein
MTTYVSVNVPQPLYRRLEQAAARLQKPVQEYLAETLQATLPVTDQLPENIQLEVAALEKLGGPELEVIAESSMAPVDQEAFEQLLDLQSMRSLSAVELAQLEALRAEYGRVLLLKARAFALLAERGSPLSLE